MENEAVLLKIKRQFSKDESIASLLEIIKGLRIEIGVLKSELSELKDKNKNLIYSHSSEIKLLKKEIDHHKKGLTTIQKKNVLLKTLIKGYNESLPPLKE